jgi:hypothetical protein
MQLLVCCQTGVPASIAVRVASHNIGRLKMPMQPDGPGRLDERPGRTLKRLPTEEAKRVALGL